MPFTNFTPKFLGGATLGIITSVYTAPTATTTRVEHLIISNGSTPGTVTVVFYDSSAAVGYELINGVSIAANGVLELANIILDPGDQIRAAAITTTDAKITLFGQEIS
ncbi:hypothetical protein V0288_11095 [Pannus brasiliensis CCIBt3594]|uniref:DUF4183 domain-containing protein n=1 Tax=Pannus brasiliensis CCIBt3594 TaxID=1427578 RepID=A0AAW9QR17_9CHRO